MASLNIPTIDEFEAVVRRVVREELAKAGPSTFSTKEAAAFARKSTKTIRNWIELGLPVTRRGRRLCIARADLERFMAGELGPANESAGDRIAAELLGGRRP